MIPWYSVKKQKKKANTESNGNTETIPSGLKDVHGERANGVEASLNGQQVEKKAGENANGA